MRRFDAKPGDRHAVNLGIGKRKVEAEVLERSLLLRGGEEAEQETRGRSLPTHEEEAAPQTPAHPILATRLTTPFS